MYPSFFSTALIQVENKIKVGNDAVKEIYDYLKYNKKKLAGEAKYIICMKILEKSLEHVEGGASKVLIFPSMMKTLIDKCSDNYAAERAYDRCKGIENSVIFDLHMIESSNVAEFNTKFLKGENTQMIIEHINNSTGSDITVDDIVHSRDKVSDVIDKYKKIEKTGDIGAGSLQDYIKEKIAWRDAKPWMH